MITNPLAINQLTTYPTNFLDQYITIMGIRLRYWHGGETGSPVLLLHGLNGSVENWRWNINTLAERHRVFALDGPGHGLSQPDARAYNLDFMRELVIEFMRSQQLERASVIASSGGGLIALKIALERPELIDKLILVDAAGLGREVNPRLRIVSMLPPPPDIVINRRLSRDELRFWLKRTFFQNPNALTQPMLEDFYTNIWREHTMRTATTLIRWGINLWGQKFIFANRLRQLKAPTLIVWGKQDQMIPVRHAYRAAQQIPNARLAVFDPCGHLPMIECSAQFNRAVLAFLDSSCKRSD